MDRETARFLLLLVNDVESYERLTTLVELKIKNHLMNLETTKEPARMYEIQGAIGELRRWEHLREEIIEAAK